MVHQGGKIREVKELERYLDWLWHFEFELYKIPIPDRVYFLNIPVQYSIERIKKRLNKFTQEEKKDIHEDNNMHLYNAYRNAKRLVERYHWHEINCIDGDNIRTIEDIHQEITEDIVSNLLRDEDV